ncbi:TMAO reductase system periplasmic protein TorT [Vibrio zhanjiangensis]|uniref:TMAO reductase system periplasmic protein TorT n=2 Tax=Vibrio zhanjiangensis TaxID=1046128 RepID=A0ABQ6F035_9VIBR|nr:TMAO reductase system periplasmic protein TorT [Vibrio zhanjiangensis]
MLRVLTTKQISSIMLLYALVCSSSVLPFDKPIKICALYPHLKDSYWLSVNYGMVNEANKLGVELKVFEAGGYPNKQKQQAQLKKCHEWQADAIILGTVSPTGYLKNMNQLVGNTPIFATVNALTLDPSSQQLKGQVGVDWYWMGYYVGEYLKGKHPKGSGQVNIALLLGPIASGGTEPVMKGLLDAVEYSDIHVVQSYWADNDKELQRNFVQRVIERNDISYIVGSAVAIEAAISELRTANKTETIGLIATYLSHGVYRGLLRKRVEFAPTDKMVQQGSMSVRQAVNYLKGQPYQLKQMPVIEPLTPENLDPTVILQSLSPSEYRPTFHVTN